MIPPKVQAALEEGICAQEAGRLADAITCFAKVREEAPWAADGWHLGGMAVLLLGRADEALILLSRAKLLNPRNTHTALGLGVARMATGDVAGAAEILRRVTKEQPLLAEGWHHLGFALHAAGRFEDAVDAHKRAIALKPGDAALWLACGSSLTMLARERDALICFDQALALAPGSLRARLGRAVALFRSFRVPEAEAEFAAVIARDPKNFEAQSYRLMALNNLDTPTREQVFSAHVAAGEAMVGPVPQNFPNSIETTRRLRVAFLSPDFRDHSVAYFFEPLLHHLSRTDFEIVLYHDHPVTDATSGRLRASAALWRHVGGRPDQLVEDVIRADAPDIVVDLAGHTGLNRLPLLARRVAPVQVSYLGYPNTTGVPAMDYRLVDELTDPPGEADALASEKLVRFSPTAWTYQPPANAPIPAPPPCAEGAPVTFGSFNNLTKATDEMLRTWADILKAVPGSRLLFKAGGLHDPAINGQMRTRLRAAGLPDDRVELLTHVPDVAAHLALYGRVDVALDPFPYHGTTTTCEALWMGVPVVTLGGDRHASRVGVSLLTAVGHPEWVALTREDYVNVAANLVADGVRLAASREGLRNEMRRSLLLNHAAQAERFGRALRDCWRQWCAQAAPVTPFFLRPEFAAAS